MIFDALPEQSTRSCERHIKTGVCAVTFFCLLLALVWYYNFHILHDAYFAAMWTPAILVSIGFAGWGAFFPNTYPPPLLKGCQQLRRLKQWRLGLILSAAALLVAGLVRVALADAARFPHLLAIPCYLCVCAWITLSLYIKFRTLARI